MLNENKQRNHLADPNSYATTLTVATIDEFGTDCFDWEPDILREEIIRHFGIKFPRINVEKLQALITALSSNTFYYEPQAFLHICRALNNREPYFDKFPNIYADDILWAVYEVYINDEPESLNAAFSDDVKRLVGTVLLREGIYTKPKELQFAIYPEEVYKETTAFESLGGLAENKIAIGGKRYQDLMADFNDSKAQLGKQLEDLTKNN